MSNTTLNGITLHDGSTAVITDNDCMKKATLIVMPLYLNDSDQTDVFDFGGAVKTINLSGTYIASDVASLKTWVDSVEALIQGHQDIDAGAPYDLVDDLRGTIKVKVFDFNTVYTRGDPTQVSWTIKLVQSSTNS
jgi:hypothetical protein